jgi:hypothetical protein
MPFVPIGKPGVQSTSYFATPREVFYGNRQFAQFLPLPLTIDGTLSSNAGNAPYTWLLFAGTLMGRETTSRKYRNSVIGLSAGAALATDTLITTDVNTVAEVARLIGVAGGNVQLTFTGPPTPGGVVAATSVTASAATGTTITLTGQIGAAKVIGSLIQPADGSQQILSILCDLWGQKIIDGSNTTRVDVFEAQLWNGGGIINSQNIVNYPTDVSLIAYIKSSLRVNIADAHFSDDWM